MGQQVQEQIQQIVGPHDRKAKLLKDSLQVFLGQLLTVKTDCVFSG